MRTNLFDLLAFVVGSGVTGAIVYTVTADICRNWQVRDTWSIGTWVSMVFMTTIMLMCTMRLFYLAWMLAL